MKAKKNTRTKKPNSVTWLSPLAKITVDTQLEARTGFV